jgi:preprotein translocase subunit SecF
MSKFGDLGHRLYTGEVSYDFIARRRRWYLISGVLIAVSLAALLGRGLQLGIEFTGGADFRATTTISSSTVPDMRTALNNSGVPDLTEATVNTIGGSQVRVQTRPLNAVTEVPKVRSAIAKEAAVQSDQVAYSLIGASWGSQITERALIALVVFLVLVSLVMWAYFRNGAMAGAALVALGHDLVLTVGIYALVGFTVTPTTLIGVLTILGYSLYDTVVVFDKVRENVRDLKSSTVRTYSEAANLGLNQVLVRSINTTIIGVLPVAALLFAGAFILGEGPLKDLALALFVGMISGAYSSIFIATPLLAQLKERDPDMKKLASRVATRRAKELARSGHGTSSAAGTPVDSSAEPVATGRGSSRSTLDDVTGPPAGNRRRTAPGAQPGKGFPEEVAEEPSDEELAAAGRARVGRSGATSITIAPTSAGAPVHPRPVSEGGAKRPQPQHKPRSQRKK